MTVGDGGETVFAETYELDPESDSANERVDDPVDGLGTYVVRATMDGETREVDTTGHVEERESCVGVRFSLLDDGSADYWVKSMQRC